MVENAPFVRAVRVEAIPEGGLERFIEADEAERFALARLNGVSTIGRLEAKFSLRRAGRGIVRVSGDVHAEAEQVAHGGLGVASGADCADDLGASSGDVRPRFGIVFCNGAFLTGAQVFLGSRKMRRGIEIGK